jgi:bacterioferritin
MNEMTQTFLTTSTTAPKDNRVSRETILGYLNASLSTELRSLVRCKKHYYASSEASDALREEFLEQAIEESMHTDRIVERIIQLGGMPDFSAQAVSDFSPSDVAPRDDLREVISEDLDAQREAIESYRNIIHLIGSSDVATCAVFEDIIRRDQHYIERLSKHL